MGRSERRPVRQYHFWRKAFWARPVLLALYGLVAGVAGIALLLAVPGSYQQGEAMERAGVCRERAESDCLVPVRAYLDGPHYKRRAGDRWYLRSGVTGARVFDSFDMATSPSNTLQEVGTDTVVTGLAWDDEIVAVKLPDGSMVTTDGYGSSRWWTMTLMALFALGMCLLVLVIAIARRRAVGGWWSVRETPTAADAQSEPQVRLGTPRGWFMACGLLLLVPAALGILPIMFLASVPLSLAAFALGLGLALLAVVRMRTRSGQDSAAMSSASMIR